MVLAVVVIVGLCPAALSQRSAGVDEFANTTGGAATEVDEQTAISVAQYYVYIAPPPAIAAAVEAGVELVLPPRPFPNAAEQVAWVFDLAVFDPAAPAFAIVGSAVSGFVVTSASFELEPLIAYSTESEFPWKPGPENALRNVLLMDLNSRLDALDVGEGCDVDINIELWNLGVAPLLGPIYACATCAAPDSSTYSGPDPIIGFPNDWHQGPPCNRRCKNNDTGCVALAMAQIIYHNKFPASATTVNGFESFNYTGSATCSNHQVQNLCYAAGSSAGTDYNSPFASGANIERAARALRETWQYNTDTASATRFGGIEIAMHSYRTLKDDMLAGRPAILNLKGSYLGQSTQHAVVCDGYKAEHQAGTELSLAFHLRMGSKDEGVNVWYSLPSDCFPPTYHALIEGVLQIACPGEIPPDACNLALNINEQDNQYDLGQWVQVKVDANRDAAAVLYAFSALIPGAWTSVTWNIKAGQDVRFLLPWPALIPGVETVVLWADMGWGCTRILPRTYVIGPDPSLLDALHVSGSYSSSSKTVSVSYTITPSNCEVSSVTAYLISPARGAERIGSSPGRTGSFQNISLRESGTGEHVVVIVASTSAGVLSRTYSFVVN